MSLSPQTKIALEVIEQARPTPIWEMSLAEYRKMVDGLANEQIMGPTEPVEKIENRTIEGRNGPIPICVYRPAAKSRAAILYFCGSGFTYGELKTQDNVCRGIANRSGYTVIQVAYRSAPEYKYPIGLNDAHDATLWVREHANELGIDPDKVGVCGYSSGGNFAALIAIQERDAGRPLFCQVLLAPALDLSSSCPSHVRYAEGYLLDTKSRDWHFAQYLPEGADLVDPNISPYWQKNLRDLPPTLIVTAEYDMLCDEAAEYANKLKEAGNAVKYSCYLGQIHAFIAWRGLLDQEENPLDEIGDYLRELLSKC